MDGAGKWRRIWHITLPGMRAVIVLLLILNLGNALTVGFERLILQRDAVGAGRAEVLDTFVYYTGVQNGDRKSTRLNSSHVATSYAVFCLKKKNELLADDEYQR